MRYEFTGKVFLSLMRNLTTKRFTNFLKENGKETQKFYSQSWGITCVTLSMKIELIVVNYLIIVFKYYKIIITMLIII